VPSKYIRQMKLSDDIFLDERGVEPLMEVDGRLY
jgi:hypothetical protein